MFIIAEAGVNHNGNVALAYQLIDEAKKAGADAVKFQTFKADKLTTANIDKAEYQKNNTGNQQSQREMLQSLELTYEDFAALKAYADSQDILFLSTPFDEDSADFLESLMPLYKIASGEITNWPFLQHIARKGKPIILSTGMASLAEVEAAIDVIRTVNSELAITVLHCTTNYPCPYEEVNLKAMLTMREAFKVPVGYSDHTVGCEIPVAAAALGAEVIEKHFTLDQSMPGPDHKASMSPDELKAMITMIRHVSEGLGDGIKRPNLSEEKIKNTIRKVVVTNKALAEGEVIDHSSVIMKRAGAGIDSKYLEVILGKRLLRPVAVDQPLQWQDFMKE